MWGQCLIIFFLTNFPPILFKQLSSFYSQLWSFKKLSPSVHSYCNFMMFHQNEDTYWDTTLSKKQNAILSSPLCGLYICSTLFRKWEKTHFTGKYSVFLCQCVEDFFISFLLCGFIISSRSMPLHWLLCVRAVSNVCVCQWNNHSDPECRSVK